jgi:hypothetical protein
MHSSLFTEAGMSGALQRSMKLCQDASLREILSTVASPLLKYIHSKTELDRLIQFSNSIGISFGS